MALEAMNKPWAEFSALEVSACHAMLSVCSVYVHMFSIAIRPNLELKTQPKQLLGCLTLDIALPIGANVYREMF